MIPVIKTLADYQAYRISPQDTNRLAIVFDPDSANDSLTVCVEIFEVGSQTPPHRHHFAVEMFFILKGEGKLYFPSQSVLLGEFGFQLDWLECSFSILYVKQL